MISAYDDFCVHQTPDYLRVPGTTDRNFYDRYFFLGYSPCADILFGIAFGRYPNRFVQDAHFTVVMEGTQHSLHASDRLGVDPAVCRVGPIEVIVEQPMRRLRCRVSDHDLGIHCDLVYEAESGAVDEGRLKVGRDGIHWIDQTRFMQYGRWSGWLEVDGISSELPASGVFGLRDKSWGVRVIGEQQVTPRQDGQIFWMNVVMRMNGRFGVFRTLDREDGSPVERAGYFAPLYADAQQVPVGEKALEEARHWTFDLQFAEPGRRILGGEYRIELENEDTLEIEGQCLGAISYAGLGYNHDTWHHGLDHGDSLVVERESWPLGEVDLLPPSRQFVASVVTFRQAGRTIGFGHTEQLLVGPYRPFGWSA